MALLLAVPGYAGDQGVPDEEMLEFLADFDTAGGRPIDPLMLADQDTEPAKQLTKTAAEKKRAGQREGTRPKQRKEQANDE